MSVVSEGGRSQGTWITLSPLPIPIAEVGVAALGGRVFVVGGTEQPGQAPPTPASNLTLSYDPVHDTWQGHAALPRQMSHVGVTELDEKLYAIGGLSDQVHLGPQNLAFVYDPVSDQWDELPPLSSPRGSMGVVAAGGRIHTFGGHDSAQVVTTSPPDGPPMSVGIGSVTTHEVYDPAEASWSYREPLPGPARDHMGVAALGHQVHVFGGRTTDFSDMLDRHDVYDTVAETWTSAAPLPRPRSAGAFVVIDDLIVYAGGECKPGGEPFTPNAFEDVDAYDQVSDKWIGLTPLPQARHAFGAATVAAVAYFAGGSLVCGGGVTTNELLALKLAP
jgi:N-acetylneuraminic acid mutarotase